MCRAAHRGPSRARARPGQPSGPFRPFRPFSRSGPQIRHSDVGSADRRIGHHGSMPESRSPAAGSIVVAGRTTPLGAYPHLRVVGDLVFVSGTSARQPDGVGRGCDRRRGRRGLVRHPGQTRAVLANVAAVLAAVGLTLDDVVDVMCLPPHDGRLARATTRSTGEHFTAETGPARTTVAVHQLPHPHLAIEIKAIARARRAGGAKMVPHRPRRLDRRAPRAAAAAGRQRADLGREYDFIVTRSSAARTSAPTSTTTACDEFFYQLTR
mgnify:CR=1 FL=1